MNHDPIDFEKMMALMEKLSGNEEGKFEDFKKACLANIDLKFEGQNLLFPAIKSHSLEKIQWLLKQGLDPESIDQHGYSPLIFSALYGSKGDDIFNYLHSRVNTLNSSSDYGESALSLSLRTGRYDRVQKLIECGASPDPVSFTPLHLAASCGNLAEIKKLALPDTIELRDRWERTPWLTAICADQLEAANLLEELGADITAKGYLGNDAIILACLCNASKSLQNLISKGISIDSRGHFKETALHTASENDALSCAEILLESGANLKALNETEAEPISLARSLEMMQLLHKHGANLNFICGAGEWPLKEFADEGDLEAIRWLLANGADPNLTSTGETALFNAIRSDHLEAAKLLIEAGADVNAQDVDGDGTFFRCKSISAAKLLLEKGANPQLRDLTGQTVTQASWVNKEVRDYLTQQMNKSDQ